MTGNLHSTLAAVWCTVTAVEVVLLYFGLGLVSYGRPAAAETLNVEPSASHCLNRVVGYANSRSLINILLLYLFAGMAMLTGRPCSPVCSPTSEADVVSLIQHCERASAGIWASMQFSWLVTANVQIVLVWPRRERFNAIDPPR